jgi:hypothetical protein
MVWLAILGLSLLQVHFLNDHFDRISRARQILMYGDRPFADFRDPGYFLTLYVSAAGQALTGGGLLGEALIASAAIATAGALTFWLAESASGSLLIGLIAAFLTWIVSPRYYDYDKVLFYMLGLTFCWRYVDSPAPGRLAAAGFVTGLAVLFRYDNGLYLLVACLAAITVRRRQIRSELLSDLALYLAVIAVTLAPALIFIQSTAGLSESYRQIATYAAREGQRSELFTLPRLGLDRTSVTYVVIVATAPAALLLLVVRSRTPHHVLQFPEAKILAAALLCICVSIFILRDPIGARLGAAAPPALVLAACIAGLSGPREHGDRPTRKRALSSGLIATVLVAACASALVVFQQQGRRLLRAPSALARRVSAVTTELAASPPGRTYFPDDGALAGIATYLRTCTPADARVLVTWFAPEVFFFSQRGFAGGMAVFLGEHWSSEADQRRTIEQVELQPVPLVIVQAASENGFRSTFPRVAAYVDAQYRLAGMTSFGDPRVGADGYRVLIKRALGDVPNEPSWALPCPE